jgi:hypothetical protein
MRDLGDISEEKAFQVVQSLGGDNGWFRYDWLWRFRGLIDKLLGGPGFNRGRRDPVELRIGDSLDFWKVIDFQRGKRLLLLAQMRLPGKAWLDFSVEKGNLVQTSYFLPKGLWGRVYWFLINPFHGLVFKDIARGIVKRAGDLA